ncbi:MAG: hypothetical protein JWM68_1681 [Verrucomicrobiales bacterium]|nr:hypothetical protein [Verrucomicrobiales bacterium]
MIPLFDDDSADWWKSGDQPDDQEDRVEAVADYEVPKPVLRQRLCRFIAAHSHSSARLRPCWLLKPMLSVVEGPKRWCASFSFASEEPQVMAFGSTPAEAFDAFDVVWNKTNLEARTLARFQEALSFPWPKGRPSYYLRPSFLLGTDSDGSPYWCALFDGNEEIDGVGKTREEAVADYDTKLLGSFMLNDALLRIRKIVTDWNVNPNRPSALVRPRFSMDEDRWQVLFGDNAVEGVVGVGSTPEEALADFDLNWNAGGR